MAPDQPRRRSNDSDRRRWSDDRLDEMRGDVDRLEVAIDRLTAIAGAVEPLSDLIQQQAQRTTDMRADMRSGIGRIDSEITALRKENRDAHTRVEAKADTVVKQTSGTNWREFFTYLVGAMAGVGIPVALALVAGH